MGITLQNGEPAENGIIESAVDQAGTNALRLALYQVTGDPELATMKISKQKIRGGVLFDYVLSAEDEQIVKNKAIEYLKSPSKPPVPGPPSIEEAKKLMNLFAGSMIKSNDVQAGFEELAFETFPRGVEWTTRPPLEKLARHKVIVIGAGLSGIAAAIQLKRLGIQYTVYERQSGVGGTWLWNTYPECRVDTLSYLFQYRFEKNYHWREYFASREETQKYLEYITRKYGVLEDFKFNKEVIAAVWDEASSTWYLTITDTSTGENSEVVSNSIISASGLFATPKAPDIKGVENFKGPMFHTTRWDHTVDYAGKSVAVIGTGSTGTQLAPGIAATAKSLAVYQRTPNWIASYEGYKSRVTREMSWLCDNMPYYWNWYCYAAYFRSLDLAALQVRNHEYEAKGGCVNERNDSVRETLTQFIKEKFKDRPDLVPKLIPKYAPLVRRLVVDNGFYDILKQQHVELVTDRIDRITERGILTEDGKERQFDIIVLSLGFETGKYFFPVHYVGRNGVSLESCWEKDGARSYLGMVNPGFPNFFSLYGPNHQPRGGSLYSWAEIWARYAVRSVVYMIEHGLKSMEVKQSVYDEYQVGLDKRIATLIWESDGAGYYVNEHGRQGVNMPWTTSEYHEMVIEPNPDDFIFEEDDVKIEEAKMRAGEAKLAGDSAMNGYEQASRIDQQPVLL